MQFGIKPKPQGNAQPFETNRTQEELLDSNVDKKDVLKKKDAANILKIARQHARKELSEVDIKVLDNRMFLEEAATYASTLAKRIKDSIEDSEELKQIALGIERVNTLAIYVMIEEMSNKDDSGQTIKALLNWPNLFMYLYQKFGIKNAIHGEGCSVNDNVWIYDFITKITEVFTLIKHTIQSKEFLDHKNIFIILLVIMHKNYIDRITTIPSIRANTAIANEELERVKREYSDNLATAKNKIISIVDGSHGNLMSFDMKSFEDIELNLSAKSLSDIELFVEKKINEGIQGVSQKLEELHSNQQVTFENIKELIKKEVADTPSIPSNINSSSFDDYDNIVRRYEHFASTIQAMLEKIFTSSSTDTKVNDFHGAQTKPAFSADDFTQLKNDIVEQARKTLQDVLASNNQVLEGLIESLRESAKTITAEAENLSAKTSGIQQLFTMIEEMKKEDDIKHQKVVSMLEAQNKNAEETLEKIQRGEI